MDSLELLHDVQMRLIPGAGGIMPFDGQRREMSAAAAPSGGPLSQTMSWPVGSVALPRDRAVAIAGRYPLSGAI